MASNVDKSFSLFKPDTWFASEGGKVTGGSPGTDSVRAMLMPDEFVVRADAARRNMGLLEALNRGGPAPTMGAGIISSAISAGFAGAGAANDNHRYFMDLYRVITANAAAQIAALREELEMVRAELREGRQSAQRLANRKPQSQPQTKVA